MARKALQCEYVSKTDHTLKTPQLEELIQLPYIDLSGDEMSSGNRLEACATHFAKHALNVVLNNLNIYSRILICLYLVRSNNNDINFII